MGALFGRKVTSVGNIGRATTSMRGMGRAAREKQDIARAKEEANVIRQKLTELEDEFQKEAAQIQEDFKPKDFELEELSIKPRKGDISVSKIALVWTPWRVEPDGLAEPAFV